jgi:transposase
VLLLLIPRELLASKAPDQTEGFALATIGHKQGHYRCSHTASLRLRWRGGLTCKIHAVVDTNGLPVRVALTAGEAHDNRLAGRLLSRLKSGSMLLADRGYDADWIRTLAAEKGAWANIPPRCNRNDPICFSPYLYRARNMVERFFNKIKHCRRVATRYDKLAANYLAFVQLASIRLWLRTNESTSYSDEASVGRRTLNAVRKAA